MKKKLVKKVFLYHGDITKGIFDSQVLHHICLMKKYNHDFMLINFIPLKIFFRKFYATKKKIDLIRKRNLKCICFLTLGLPKLSGRIAIIFYSSLLSVLFKIYNVFGYYVIIHAREMFATVMGVNMKKLGINCRLVYDMRSDEVREYRYKFRREETNLKRRNPSNIGRIQSTALRNCDVCLMVSHALKEYVATKYGFTPKSTYVIPSVGRSDIFFFDSDIRTYMRKSLGLENKFVLGYSGAMQPWQRMDKVFEMFVYISEIQKDALLLVLTKETTKAEKVFEEYAKNSSIMIKDINYEVLGKYIQCFDVGLLLRDKLLLNKVASPTKFAEYILCGVPVFISTGVGDLEEATKQQNLGICIENFNDKDELKSKVQEFLNCRFNRSAIADYGRKKYSREAYVNVYNEIYANSMRIR